MATFGKQLVPFCNRNERPLCNTARILQLLLIWHPAGSANRMPPKTILPQSFALFQYHFKSAICLSKKLQAGFPL